MNNEEYKSLFYQSLRIRLVEEKIIELYPSDLIQSPVHLSIGQEAIAVGICQNLKMFGTLGPVLLTLTCSAMALEIMGIE